MKVTVKLFATCREGRFDVRESEYPAGTTAGDVIGELAIEGSVKIIFVNGRHARPGQELRDGDTIALFPPVGGG